MNKDFDCIKFKYELQDKTLKNSNAKNLQDYVVYVNKIAQQSSLYKKGTGDYTEWQKTLWENKTIDEIHQMAVEFEENK